MDKRRLRELRQKHQLHNENLNYEIPIDPKDFGWLLNTTNQLFSSIELKDEIIGTLQKRLSKYET